MKIALAIVVCLAIGVLSATDDPKNEDEATEALQTIVQDAKGLLREVVAKEVDRQIKKQKLKRLEMLRSRARGINALVDAWFEGEPPKTLTRLHEIIMKLLSRAEKKLK